MINKRLICLMQDSMSYVYKNVFIQWVMLVMNIFMMALLAFEINAIFENSFHYELLFIVFILMIIRYLLSKKSVMMGYEASKQVKQRIREMILVKLNQLGSGYHLRIQTSALVQLCVEGIDQLEIYFGSYLSQFMYSILAPITLFIVLAFVNIKVAILLLICVPLIPLTIILVSKIAKKLLNKYWTQYTTLGDSFLENLEGLTTLKIYEADEYQQQKMNHEAELFRKITMKVLSMQLNSITIMDIVAFGGASLGMILALYELQAGHIQVVQAIFIILISADFFIPMRTLGSLFHVAMNGVSASEKLFKFLDEEVDEDGIYDEFAFETIQLNHVCFSYDEKRVVDDVCLELKPESLCCLVGESGCGKSTIASLIMKQYKPDVGEITINEIDLTKIKRETWMNTCTYVSSDPFLFKGSIRDNLMMGKKTNDEEYIEVLKKVKIYDYLKNENGLDTMILEKGSNFSKGQCQRIAFARALLKDSAFYIFDEATSNIDVESENDLMQLIQELSKEKGVLFITHRLMNVVESDVIYVMKNAQIVGVGKHEELLKTSSDYQELWMSQMELENWKGEEHGK